MIFEIDFNRQEWTNDELLKQIGAKIEKTGPFGCPTIEVNTLDDLKRIEDEIQKATGDGYSLIIGFEDMPTIFLDKTI